ncbi:MAG: hypothetical protein J0H68_08540 [Sphingobacteriia bacterium]|nr:hypothetical protein [Sphingobacteriia bacterium]
MKKHTFLFFNGYDIEDSADIYGLEARISSTELNNKLKENISNYSNVSAYFLGNESKGFTFSQMLKFLRVVKGQQSDFTIFVSAHGSVTNDKHSVQTSEKESLSSSALLKILHEAFTGYNYNIVLSSCYSHILTKELSNLTSPFKGNVIILSSEEENEATDFGAYFYKLALIDYLQSGLPKMLEEKSDDTGSPTKDLVEFEFDFNKSVLEYIRKLGMNESLYENNENLDYLVKKAFGSLPIIYSSNNSEIHDLNKEVKDIFLGDKEIDPITQPEAYKARQSIEKIESIIEERQAHNKKDGELPLNEKEEIFKKQLEGTITSFEYPEVYKTLLKPNLSLNREEFTKDFKENYEDEEPDLFENMQVNMRLDKKSEDSENELYHKIDNLSDADYYREVELYNLLIQREIIFNENKFTVAEYVAMEDLGLQEIHQNYNQVA